MPLFRSEVAPTPSSLPLRRRRFTKLAALVVGAMTATSLAPTSHAAEASEARLITLPIHRDRVDDVYWSDTWGAARSGGRSHIGVDMMGEKMIPLVAVRSGTITWGRFDNNRGSILRFRDDDGWEYQYIHLNNDTPGTDDASASCTQTFSARICSTISGGRLASGTRLTEGEIIGYLGDGGNAEWTAPHLHFEMYRPDGSGGVTPVNPTASVDAARDRLKSSPNSAGSRPGFADPGEAGFAEYLWFTVHGRYPTSSERAGFESSAGSDVWAAVGAEIDDGSTAATIDRLYLAFFQRYPDTDGIQYWIEQRGAGYSAESIAEWFAESDEFIARYGGTDFGEFLDLLYADVLERDPDESGKEYWLEQLDDGEVTRGTIVVYFTESVEMRGMTDKRNEAVALHLLRHGDVPSDADVAAWVQLRETRSFDAALAEWYAS